MNEKTARPRTELSQCCHCEATYLLTPSWRKIARCLRCADAGLHRFVSEAPLGFKWLGRWLCRREQTHLYRRDGSCLRCGHDIQP